MRVRRMIIVVAAMLMFAGTALARHRTTPSIPSMEIDGVIKSISSTEIVVTTEGNHDVTARITADTVFRKGDMAIAPADLKVGDRVEVKAVVKDNVVTALLVRLENDENNQGPELLEINGVIKSVSSTQLVVTDAHNTDITVKITPTTMIRKGDHAATAGDLVVGDRVEVKATVSGGVNTAVLIQAEAGQPQQQEVEVDGAVTAVGSGSITVHTRNHGDVVVKVDTNTTIRRNDHQIAIGEIHVGDEVEAQGTRIDDHTMLARQIDLQETGQH
jgi:hypothetical protein